MVFGLFVGKRIGISFVGLVSTSLRYVVYGSSVVWVDFDFAVFHLLLIGVISIYRKCKQSLQGVLMA
jgi:site-specific recombinase